MQYNRQVTLNGDLLKLTADVATLPDLTPKQQVAGETLQLPTLFIWLLCVQECEG